SRIRVGARVCVACGAAQNWLGTLNLSSTILALLIALFSVLATTLPIIKKTVMPWSDIKVETVGITPSEGAETDVPPEWHVLVTNAGERAGIIMPIANVNRDSL